MRVHLSVLTFLLSICFASLTSGQSLGLRAPQRNFMSDPSNLQVAHVTLFNLSSNTLNIKVKRLDNVLDSAHQSYFCWGPVCYSPFTSVSALADTVLANDSNITFRAYLEPNGAEGESHVSYCFYDENHMSDSVCLSFTHHFGALGLTERNKAFFVSDAYPNPAKDYTSISYSLPSTSKLYVLKLFDIYGQTIRQQNIYERNGTLLLPLEGLVSGVYQYAFYCEGKGLSSKKIIVMH